MTDSELIAFEARIKRALLKTEAAIGHARAAAATLHQELHDLRAGIANDRGVDVSIMSGGDADEKGQEPPAP